MESEKHNFWPTVLIIDLVILNSFLIYSFFRPQKNDSKDIVIETCDKKCQENIDSKLNELTLNLEKLKLELQVTPTPVKISVAKTVQSKPVVKTKTKNTFYVEVPGSGSVLSNDWTSIPTTEFYFDTRDFPGLVNIYFDANMKLFNGNGLAFVRLYDSTHGVGVQGSEVQTSSQADTVVTSGQVSFYDGKNLIKVQAKSLTADTTVFNSGRLKITTEN